jgi:hypothetical protein
VLLDQNVDLDTTEGCLDGQAWASTALSLDLYAMNPGGFFDLANDSPVVSAHHLFPWSVGDSLFRAGAQPVRLPRPPPHPAAAADPAGSVPPLHRHPSRPPCRSPIRLRAAAASCS